MVWPPSRGCWEHPWHVKCLRPRPAWDRAACTVNQKAILLVGRGTSGRLLRCRSRGNLQPYCPSRTSGMRCVIACHRTPPAARTGRLTGARCPPGVTHTHIREAPRALLGESRTRRTCLSGSRRSLGTDVFVRPRCSACGSARGSPVVAAGEAGAWAELSTHRRSCWDSRSLTRPRGRRPCVSHTVLALKFPQKESVLWGEGTGCCLRRDTGCAVGLGPSEPPGDADDRVHVSESRFPVCAVEGGAGGRVPC